MQSSRVHRGVLLLLASVLLLSIGASPAARACTADIDCDDSNVCTDDHCDVAQGCKHYNNSSACNDGNACTTNDVCNGAACVGGNTASGCASCAAVATIPAQGGTFFGQTSGTGTLSGSCGPSNTSGERVYVWTPPTSGQATISTCASATLTDTVVYLRSGTCTGTEVACNDDACTIGDGTAHGSRITPTVVGGQPYYIVVDGHGGSTGAYSLSVFPPQTCGNNVREGSEQCDGTDASGCSTGTCTIQCTCLPPPGGLPDLTPAASQLSIQWNATVAAGDAAEGCAEATSGVNLLRFTATMGNSGTADLSLGDPQCPACATACGTCLSGCGGSCTSCSLCLCGNPEFVCSPAGGHNHAHYANYARYELLDANSQAVIVGHKQGFCLLDSICGAGSTQKYTCTNQGITAGCSDIYETGLGCQYLDITGIPAGNYQLRVTVDPFNLIPELTDGNNVTTTPVTIPAGPPCLNPSLVQTIPAAGGTITGTTSGTSTLNGSCAQAASDAAPEQVFAWTPNASGTATISTCGTATKFDTVVYVLSGTCVDSEIACNDDTSGCPTGDVCSTSSHHGSVVKPTVTAGQTYYLVVDGYGGSCGGSSGAFSLTVTPPTGGPTTTTSTSTSVPTSTSATTSSTSTTSSSRTSTSTTSTSTSSTTSSTLGGGTGTCSVPIVVPPAGGVITGVTAGTSALGGSCAPTPSAGAPEQVFVWTPAASGSATIQTCSTTTKFDTVLYVRDTSCAGAELACNDDTLTCGTGDACVNNGHHGSLLTLNVTANHAYVIVVDGYAGSCGGSSGAFALTVTAPAGPTTTSTSSTTTVSSTSSSSTSTSRSTTSTSRTTTTQTSTTSSSSSSSSTTTVSTTSTTSSSQSTTSSTTVTTSSTTSTTRRHRR